MKPRWFDTERGEVCMDYVSGIPLSMFPRDAMTEAEYHCGVWLALYHAQVLKGELEGPIYTDLNVHNVLIDRELRQVTALDPGMGWGRIGCGYEDLVHHLQASPGALLARGRARPTALLGFLRGYAHASRTRPELGRYYRSLGRELRRGLVDQHRKSRLRAALFVVLATALLPLSTIAAPLLRGRR